MSGSMVSALGIGLIAASVILMAVSSVYRRTAGRRILEALRQEYEL